MLRITFIEQIRRLIYGAQPNDDAVISVGLVNVWLEQAIAFAARKNYTDTFQMEGVSYVNNSFYTTFKNLPIVKDEQFLYKVVLPQIPVGIGANEGVETMLISDAIQNSYPVVWLTMNQTSYQRGMRPIQNKLVGYPEGQNVYILSTIPLITMTAKVTMISGGDSTDLNSTINVPNDYFPTMTEFLKTNLMFQREVPQDTYNDGADFVKTV